ncbi:GTPase Era [Buchnera aphidicola (Hyadaphis tataricae)]|uniref:GTPase Era n=1 Tax=Buchnera aphidicola (Hyadaphis tataricae) TaxID=1241859 RepID=A0A4D6XUN1_9GAMM|nr:GTPase Era [Buchnera aphidicola]QCI21562.1 GTPase Era [Buchnera aphidicola (Hyadaphis tataricae)]
MNTKQKYCGKIAIIGKPNVGKSTLLNHILEKKISIVSRKRNTTQNNILGVKTIHDYQAIYIDTPGMIFNKNFNSINHKQHFFYQAIHNAILIIFVIDKLLWTKDDDLIFNQVKEHKIPVILVINKIDKINNKNILLPFIDVLKKKNIAIEIVPMSVRKRKHIFFLSNIIQSFLPKNPHIYSKNYVTQNSHVFTTSEIIREKLISFLRNELPSILKVHIELFKKQKNKELIVKAIILVKNARQKQIVIGRQGEKIKKISMIARSAIAKEFHVLTHLFLWVKINCKK